VADVDGISERRSDGHGSARDDVGEGCARNELHDNRAMVADLDDVVNAGDVWIVQRGERLRFALEAGEARRIIEA